MEFTQLQQTVAPHGRPFLGIVEPVVVSPSTHL